MSDELDFKTVFQTSLGLAIAKRRIKLNMTQAQLARASSIHRTYVGDIERGERNVTVLTLFDIALALGVTSSALMRACEPTGAVSASGEKPRM